MARMNKAEIISYDPEFPVPQLVFTGTRVPVQRLIDYLSAERTLGTFLENYPAVSLAQAQGYLQLSHQAMEALHKEARITLKE